MVTMLLILFVFGGNFAMGFMLAAHFGHGPTWAEIPHPDAIRTKLRAVLRIGGSSGDAAH